MFDFYALVSKGLPSHTCIMLCTAKNMFSFRRLKRKNMKTLYSNFITNLKSTNPRKWFQMPKKIGPIEQPAIDDELQIEELKNLTDEEVAEAIAVHFSKVSNEYSPVDLLCERPKRLPCCW